MAKTKPEPTVDEQEEIVLEDNL